MNHQDLRLAVLYELISKFDDVNKTQMQKLGYFVQQYLDVPAKYQFRMYHYGPYSEELETDMARLRFTGYIDIEPDPQGYGFHITSSDSPREEWKSLIEPHSQMINTVVETFGSRSTNELELAATIHFVKNLMSDRPTDEVLERVKGLKPKFHEVYIRQIHDELEQLNILR